MVTRLPVLLLQPNAASVASMHERRRPFQPGVLAQRRYRGRRGGFG